MPNLINFDSTNNITFYNYFDNYSDGVITKVGNDPGNANAYSIVDALNTAWGANSAIYVPDQGFYCIPNSVHETLSDRVCSTSNFRVRFSLPCLFTNSLTSKVTDFWELNSTTSTSGVISVVNPIPTNTYHLPSASFIYGIITKNNATFVFFEPDTGILGSHKGIISFGWVENSRYPTRMASRMVYIFSQTWAFSCGVEDTTEPKLLLSTGDAQYPITCTTTDFGSGLSPTLDLWCTDLWLRDVANSFAIGRIPHLLLAKGSSFINGKLYGNFLTSPIDNISTGLTSTQDNWLCAGDYGTDKLLLRVFTENIL